MQSDLQFSCIGLFDGRVVFRVMNEWERESYGPGFFLPLGTARYTAVTAVTAGVR
jgi:hypothetical protein